jgi:tetratricopeptide (TPR) repeat protein
MKSATKKAKVDELIPITPKEIPAGLKRGKAYLAAGQYQEAIKYFSCILKIAPGNMETRVWMRKAKQALAHPEGAPAAQEEKPHYCVYMMMGVVEHRLCTSDYNCYGCDFDRQMQERAEAGDTEIVEALERYKSLPGGQRFCRYSLKGNVSFRLCSRLIDCSTCEFNQMMENVSEHQLVQRHKALRTKEQGWWWDYWG